MFHPQKEKKMHWNGLIGSSKVFAIDVVASQVPGNHVIVLSDKEEAAYFLNDLQELNPKSNHVLFFPETSRVPYQLERTDNANLVSRAETLDRIHETSNCLVVTYPKALAEFVITKKILNENTLVVEKDKTYSIDFINELLIEFGFEKVDFVYQPGQFSVRGGIVDVFSFVNDHPYRIEFFGDEVDSIRTFNPVDQLSISNHVKMTIVPNVQDRLLEESHVSFFEFLPKQSTLWIKDVKSIRATLKATYDLAKSKFDELHDSPVKRMTPAELFLNPSNVYKHIEKFNLIEFGAKPHFEVEKKFDPTQRIPDVVITSHGEKIIVEITVSHPCSPDKIREFKFNNVNALEFDFQDFKPISDIITDDEIAHYFKQNANIARWISVAPCGYLGQKVHQHERGGVTRLNKKYKQFELKKQSQLQAIEYELSQKQKQLQKVEDNYNLKLPEANRLEALYKEYGNKKFNLELRLKSFERESLQKAKQDAEQVFNQNYQSLLYDLEQSYITGNRGLIEQIQTNENKLKDSMAYHNELEAMIEEKKAELAKLNESINGLSNIRQNIDNALTQLGSRIRLIAQTRIQLGRLLPGLKEYYQRTGTPRPFSHDLDEQLTIDEIEGIYADLNEQLKSADIK